jgi:hypothetical protein
MRLYEKHDMNSIRFENYLGDKLLMWEQVLLDVKDNGEFEFDQGIYLIDVSTGFKEERVPVALDGAHLYSLFYTGENIYILYKAGDDKLGIRIADMSGQNAGEEDEGHTERDSEDLIAPQENAY